MKTTIFTNPTTTLKPFFTTLSSNTTHQLLAHFYGEEDYEREMEREGTSREDIFRFIQNNYSELRICKSETGEIILEIPLTPKNLEEDGEKMLGAFANHQYIFSWFFPDSIQEILEEFRRMRERLEREFEELDNGVNIGGVFSHPKCLTYNYGGVRVHKPPMEGIFAEHNDHIIHLKFTEMDGTETDHFYSNCNDFQKWLFGRAIRGERFKVFFSENGRDWMRVVSAKNYVDTKNGVEAITLTTDVTGKWKEKKPQPGTEPDCGFPYIPFAVYTLV